MKPKQPPYNLATLETALKIAARILTIHGDKYLPIFDCSNLDRFAVGNNGLFCRCSDYYQSHSAYKNVSIFFVLPVNFHLTLPVCMVIQYINYLFIRILLI
jgi:hypothetical protein